MEEEEESQTQDPAEEEDEELRAQDPVKGGGRSHVSVPEALFVLLICVGLDWMELTLSFTGIALLLSFLDFSVWILFTLLFALKGGSYNSLVKKIVIWTLANILELVPLLEMLPIRTIVMVWVIWSWNHEVDTKLEEKLDQIARYEEKTAQFIGAYLSRIGAEKDGPANESLVPKTSSDRKLPGVRDERGATYQRGLPPGVIDEKGAVSRRDIPEFSSGGIAGTPRGIPEFSSGGIAGTPRNQSKSGSTLGPRSLNPLSRRYLERVAKRHPEILANRDNRPSLNEDGDGFKKTPSEGLDSSAEEDLAA